MLTDYLLRESLRNHPVFLRKLMAFAEDYGLAEKPALVWQCSPLEALEVDVHGKRVLEAMEQGAGAGNEQGWWYGFRSMWKRTFVFDGVASDTHESESGWAAECHTDGHVIAGLWNFPMAATNDGHTPIVMPFHGGAFSDFATFAKSLMNAADYTGGCQLTCSMLHASSLPYSENPRWQPVPLTYLRRSVLQWRVRACANPDEMVSIASLMRADFFRAYGVQEPRG